MEDRIQIEVDTWTEGKGNILEVVANNIPNIEGSTNTIKWKFRDVTLEESLSTIVQEIVLFTKHGKPNDWPWAKT